MSDASGRERYWFTIEELQRERSFVLRACIDLRSGRSFDPVARRPRAYSDSTWAFHLEPAEGDRTRVLVRSRVEASPPWRAALMSVAFGLPSHAIMQARQFRNLARLAETRPGQAPEAPSARSRAESTSAAASTCAPEPTPNVQ
jgi:proline iminopeptidase